MGFIGRSLCVERGVDEATFFDKLSEQSPKQMMITSSSQERIQTVLSNDSYDNGPPKHLMKSKLDKGSKLATPMPAINLQKLTSIENGQNEKEIKLRLNSKPDGTKSGQVSQKTTSR